MQLCSYRTSIGDSRVELTRKHPFQRISKGGVRKSQIMDPGQKAYDSISCPQGGEQTFGKKGRIQCSISLYLLYLFIPYPTICIKMIQDHQFYLPSCHPAILTQSGTPFPSKPFATTEIIQGCVSMNNIMALQPRHTEEHFRETGKFKPISDLHHPPERNPLKITLQSFIRLPPPMPLPPLEGSRLWRVYLDENTLNSSEQSIKQSVVGAFQALESLGGLGEGGQLFVNAGGVLVQRLREKEQKFWLSHLDYSCAVVRLLQSPGTALLDVYLCDGRPPADRDFADEISIRLKQTPDVFFLVQRSRMLYIVKNLLKNYPLLEMTDHNLEESTADVEGQTLTIKNLSVRIVAVKFQEDNYSRSNEPLMITVNSREVYQQLLFRINRIKYQKYRTEEVEVKDWHSFDNNCPRQLKKESKTTPDKTKAKPNKVSILSTNAVEQSKQSENKKKLTFMAQPRHLKISQRVATNPKQSNLVPSEVQYAVSVKDEKEKENPYLDQFQNLLFEQQGGEDKQLALNDSFEQFEKKEHSEKNLQIIKQLNKRKEKETEEKRMLDSLKQKIKELIAEEKEWINKNLKLKTDIKKLKNPQTPDQNREIDEIKIKIAEMKIQEKLLMEELNQIKKNNCIQTLVFCDGVPHQESSQSQRAKDNKIFHSINNLPVQQSGNFSPLTTSVRSNGGSGKFPQQPVMPPPLMTSEVLPGHPIYKQSYRPNFPGMLSPPANPGNLYSSIPTQSTIQQIYGPVGQSKGSPMLTSSNEYAGFPRPAAHTHQNSMAFTSAIFPSGRMAMGSPLGAKKSSFQVFPTANNGNKN